MPVDPVTPASLRTAAIYGNYRALVDTSSGGGYGRLYGPLVPPTTADADGKIYGVEYLAYAKGKGKRLAIPEWAIAGPRYRKNRTCNDPGFDNPLFMQLFNGWLRQNAGSIAFEAYFNANEHLNPRNGTHQIAPATWNPRAAAMYRQLW